MSTTYTAQLVISEKASKEQHETLKRFLGFIEGEAKSDISPVGVVINWYEKKLHTLLNKQATIIVALDKTKAKYDLSEMTTCRIRPYNSGALCFTFSESGNVLSNLDEFINLFLLDESPDFAEHLRLMVSEYDDEENEYTWHYLPKNGRMELSTGHHVQTSLVILF